MNGTPSKSRDSESYAKHRREQVLRRAFETTPQQRLAFIEQALLYCQTSKIDYQAQKRVQNEKNPGVGTDVANRG